MWHKHNMSQLVWPLLLGHTSGTFQGMNVPQTIHTYNIFPGTTPWRKGTRTYRLLLQYPSLQPLYSGVYFSHRLLQRSLWTYGWKSLKSLLTTQQTPRFLVRCLLAIQPFFPASYPYLYHVIIHFYQWNVAISTLKNY